MLLTMTGLDEILRLKALLEDRTIDPTRPPLSVLVLHSAISPAEQHKAFRPPPPVNLLLHTR